MNMSWKLFSGFVIGFLFLPLIVMLDKYVGPGAGSIGIAMIGMGISVAACVWLIEKMKHL